MRQAERRHRERGAGLISTSFGLIIFIVFLLFAVQLLVNLYATSVVTAITYDTARDVAVLGRPPTQAEQEAAAARARQQLGAYGQSAQFDFDTSDPTVVKLRVRVANPRFINQYVGLDVIDRTVVVRVEQQP
jgi:Flp pilus assembly protein TadG